MGFYYFDYTYFIYMLPALLLSMFAQYKVKSTFQKYSRVMPARPLTGRDAAEAVLRFGSVRGVSVRAISGSLTDHFDPRTQVISLSSPVYGVSSISAVGVAAHEAGHAIQHSVGYLPNKIRSFLVPITNLGSSLSMPLIFIGLLLPVQYDFVVLIGIGLYSLMVLFQLVTLPVEFNASARALRALDQAGVLYPNELQGARLIMDRARTAALQALLQVDINAGYSNLVMDKTIRKYELKGRDAAFASTLFYGVLERRITLDFAIARFSKLPLASLAPKVLEILRLGAYQILFLDRVPDSAAVSESVELAKQQGAGKAAGFVNGVLRSLIRGKETLSWPDDSIRYSCPAWLLELWTVSYGKEVTSALMECLSKPVPIFIRVNTIRTNREELIHRLAEEGVTAHCVPQSAATLVLEKPGAIASLETFREGLFHVQDLSSQLAACALGAKPGERVIDVCSAPGGKAFTLAEEMNNQGELLAFDKYKGKVRLISSGAERLGLAIIQASMRDAEAPKEPLIPADRVLCDAPCSGLGILRRKPEIRYKEKSTLDSLPDLQYRILCEAARLVKPGGTLLYSTCTLNPAENNGVADRFLKEHPEFSALPIRFSKEIPRAVPEPENQFTLFPSVHGTDGFFVSLFTRLETV